MALTNKQQTFVEHYLQCWNATEAARLAGYAEKTANREGSRLLSNVDISAAIVARLVDLKAGADEVIKRLTDHARGSMEDFLLIDDAGTGSIDLRQAKTRGQLHLIKKFKSTRRTLPEGVTETTNELELYDAQTALGQLGRAHALFAEKMILDWREQARREGHDPDELHKQLVEQFRAALVGSRRGRSLEGSPTAGGPGASGTSAAVDTYTADSD